MELLTKMIEKILSIYKPDAFKSLLHTSVNLEQATEEVEKNTGGLSKLMLLRV